MGKPKNNNSMSCYNCEKNIFLYRRSAWSIPVAIIVIFIWPLYSMIGLFVLLFLPKRLQCIECKKYTAIPAGTEREPSLRINFIAKEWEKYLNNPPAPPNVQILSIPWWKRPVGKVIIISILILIASSMLELLVV